MRALFDADHGPSSSRPVAGANAVVLVGDPTVPVQPTAYRSFGSTAGRQVPVVVAVVSPLLGSRVNVCGLCGVGRGVGRDRPAADDLVTGPRGEHAAAVGRQLAGRRLADLPDPDVRARRVLGGPRREREPVHRRG